MTNLGLYLKKRSVNLSDVSRKTGLGRSRLSKLSINPNTRVTAEELYKIALAIQEDPGEMFRELFAGLSLADFPDQGV